MAEHEQGAERWASRLSIAHEGMWEVFRRRPGLPEEEFLVRFHYSADDLRDYLNALEADLAALRQQLAAAEAKAALAGRLASRLDSLLSWHHTMPDPEHHLEVPIHQTIGEMAACDECSSYADVLVEFQALSRDTGSEEGKG